MLVKPMTMKTYYFLTAIVALALAGCGTAYQAGQTPDAVYYSPDSNPQPARTTSNTTDQYAVANNNEGGNYVVYQDGDEYYSDYDEGYSEGYSDGYYSRRIRMFDRPGGLFSYNYHMMSSPWYGGSYLWNRFSYNSFGWYHNPYMWSPGLSFGLSWGNPYAFGGWYSPYYSYSNYYYPGYYHSGWGWGGKYSIYEPRPAVSYRPRRSAGSRASSATRSASGVAQPHAGADAPRRVFKRSSSEDARTDTKRTRRSFSRTDGESTTPVRRTNNERRVYKPRSDEQPVRRVRSNNNTRSRTPTRTTQRTSTRRVQRSQPRVQRRTNTRSVSRPSTPTRTRSTSHRTSSPRRR